MPKNLVIYFSILLCLSGCRSFPMPSKQTGNVEAAARYLDISCPLNRELESLKTDIKRKEELVKRGELTNQDYGRFLDEILLAIAANSAQGAKAMTDPGFIWPENIRSLVAEMAAATMEQAASFREFVRSDGGYTAASQQNLPWPGWPGKDASQRRADKSSAIRSALRLPPRNEGCSNGQRALTTDQIRALQQN